MSVLTQAPDAREGPELAYGAVDDAPRPVPRAHILTGVWVPDPRGEQPMICVWVDPAPDP